MPWVVPERLEGAAPEVGLDSVSDAVTKCGVDDSEIHQDLLVDQCGYGFPPEMKVLDQQICFVHGCTGS